MFPILLWIDPGLYRVFRESRLEFGLVLRMACIHLRVEETDPSGNSYLSDSHCERVFLDRRDFFLVLEISRKKEVDPSLLLSYAFTEALLDILRL